jgi:Zn-dependent metallo-hydrolase RNA specificity domain
MGVSAPAVSRRPGSGPVLPSAPSAQAHAGGLPGFALGISGAGIAPAHASAHPASSALEQRPGFHGDWEAPKGGRIAGLDDRDPKRGTDWDDYGQSMSVNRFAIGEDPAEAEGSGPMYGRASQLAVSSGALGPGSSSEHDDAPDTEIPTRDVERTISLTVACCLVAVDRSGLSEGDALKHLVKEVEPRRVILVNGTEDETAHLQEHLLHSLYTARDTREQKQGVMRLWSNLKERPVPDGKLENVDAAEEGKVIEHGKVASGGELGFGSSLLSVSCPSEGETIDVTSNTSVHELTLDEPMVGRLRWNRIATSAIALSMVHWSRRLRARNTD